jgi:hypothetical protein
MERWLPIPGYQGFYEASDQGRIRSLNRKVKLRNGRSRLVPSRVLRLTPDRLGYPRVGLSRDGQPRLFLVHRLVLEAFVGPCPEGMEACHNDGDPANSRVDNLRWDTRAGNFADKRQHDTHNQGERHPMAKLAESQVLAIYSDQRSERKIAADYGVSRATVGRIKRRESWACVDRSSGASASQAPS